MTGYTIHRKYGPKNKVHKLFLCSDLHLDALSCDIELLKSELDEASAQGADIAIGGDVFDALLPGDKKRYTAAGDPFHTDQNLNEAVKKASAFLKPYAKNIVAIGHGNHETSVMKFNSFDPVDALIYILSQQDGVDIKPLHYTGFLRYSFGYESGNGSRTHTIYFNHGQGATAEISKGLIMVDRHRKKAVADLYWFGHTHTKVVLPSENVIYMDSFGQLKEKTVKAVITGCYNKVFYDSTGKQASVMYGEERMRTNQATGGAMVIYTNEPKSVHPLRVQVLV